MPGFPGVALFLMAANGREWKELSLEINLRVGGRAKSGSEAGFDLREAMAFGGQMKFESLQGCMECGALLDGGAEVFQGRRGAPERGDRFFEFLNRHCEFTFLP